MTREYNKTLAFLINGEGSRLRQLLETVLENAELLGVHIVCIKHSRHKDLYIARRLDGGEVE